MARKRSKGMYRNKQRLAWVAMAKIAVVCDYETKERPIQLANINSERDRLEGLFRRETSNIQGTCRISAGMVVTNLERRR